jgi:molecular chaperone DnaK
LGGEDIDRRLIDYLLGKVKAAGGPDLEEDIEAFKRLSVEAASGSTLKPLSASTQLTILSRIREAAEQAKIRLSTETEVEIALPFLMPNFSFSCKLTREELETLAHNIVARTRAHCLCSLADAKLQPSDLDQVILVGGQTRMPLVRRFVAELFGCAEFEETRGNIRLGADYHRPKGPQLNTSVNPEEAVALGAAIQAEILSGGFKSVLLLDVTPLSLGIETFGGLMNVIIPRNSTIPVKAGEMFTTAVDNQRNMLIHVLQGERERAKDNWSLGKFTLEFEPAPRGVARVGVQFEIDANGILHVLARDIKTGAQTIVEMQSAVDVDDAEVQQMVETSLEHAFEDLAARRWIEAKLRAHETVKATRRGLRDCADELQPDYKTQIEQAVADVEAVLAVENSDANLGDLNDLKAATEALDEVTKPLADILMNRVMEKMLRKKGVIK